MHTANCRDAGLETTGVADTATHTARVHDEPAVGADSFLKRDAQMTVQSRVTRVTVLGSTGTETSCKHFLDCSDTSGVVFCDPTHSL